MSGEKFCDLVTAAVRGSPQQQELASRNQASNNMADDTRNRRDDTRDITLKSLAGMAGVLGNVLEWYDFGIYGEPIWIEDIHLLTTCIG